MSFFAVEVPGQHPNAPHGSAVVAGQFDPAGSLLTTAVPGQQPCFPQSRQLDALESLFGVEVPGQHPNAPHAPTVVAGQFVPSESRLVTLVPAQQP